MKKMNEKNIYVEQEKVILNEKETLNKMIASLPEWNDSEEMQKVLLGQINSKRRYIKYLESKLNITKFIDKLIK